MDRLEEKRMAYLARRERWSTSPIVEEYMDALEAELDKAREANKHQTDEVIRACRLEAEFGKARKELSKLRREREENANYRHELQAALHERKLFVDARGTTELVKTRESLSALLDIFESPEMEAQAMSAWAHGVTVDEEISKRNGATLDTARKLLGRR